VIFLFFQTSENGIITWIQTNFNAILISIITIIVGYIIYFIFNHEFSQLELIKKMNSTSRKSFLRIIKIILILIILSIILGQFGESLATLTSLIPILAGTILGFAAMNTLGNLIAGIIIITSKPFVVGDRIQWDNRMADVIEITLMFTILEDLDKIKIIIPNQKLLTTEINNMGSHDPIRRSVTITVGFNEEINKLEKVLIEAAKEIPEVLPDPSPYVWITEFKDYTIEGPFLVFNEKFHIV
jgi:small conductance mechanosensitive channel